jgi:LCP family protein required for cell wall assembly
MAMRAPSTRSNGRRRRASGRPRPLLGALLIVLGFLISGTAGAGAYYAPAVTAAFQATGQKVNVRPPAPSSNATAVPAAQQPPGSAFTVLLLGSDNDAKYNNWGGAPLSQSMILTRVDPAARTVTMLSIPRDYYLPLWSNGSQIGYDKIMVAFSRGGAQAAEETVTRNFDVKIDNYVWIGLQGLVKLIDTVGGVDVVTTNPVLDDNYPNDINTENPYSFKRVAVLPGAQHMNGLQAMDYVRSRHSDPNGDLGRSARQQQVLVALKAKAKNLNPADIPDLVATFKGELKTDMDLGRAAQLLPVARQIQSSSINQVVLIGLATDATVGEEQVLRPNMAAVTARIHQYFPSSA